jgi:iron complex outermembrane recepter protein
MNYGLRMMLAASAGSLVCFATAQAADSAREQDSATLQEVVVTAERREETVQKSPLAIAVIDPDELSQRGVKDFSNIDKLLPDVSVDRIVGSFRISIRGIQSGATSPTTETPNAVHVDGAYIDRPGALDALFYDVQRMEVLKGPQGTLYGRNTPAGVVNIITNEPGKEFGGNGRLELGSYSLLSAEGALNMPVSDNFALRLAVREYKHDGYFKSGFDDADQQSARLKGLWTISDTAKLRFSLDFQKIDQSATPGSNIVGYTADTTATPATVPVPRDPFDDRGVNGAVASKYFFKVDNKGLMAQFDKSLSFADLTVQAAYRKFNVKQTSPGISDGAPPPQPTLAIAIPTLFNDPVDSKWSTLEARLASTGKSNLDWVVGAFSFNSTTDWAADNYQPATLAFAGPAFFSLGGHQTARSYAIFGQTTWTPVERLHLTAGLRYNNDHKKANSFESFPLLGIPATRYPATGDSEETWTKVTGTGRVAFDITPQNMIYASYSTGYQAGGYGYGSTPKFQPETNNAYEIGSKNRFLNDRLQLNAELYHYDDKGHVVNIFRLLNPGTPQQAFDLSLVNVGHIRYQGVSLDLQWAASAADRVRVGWSYIDGKYVDFVQPGPVISQYSGEPVNGPKTTGRIDYTHTFRLAQGSLDLNLAGQYRGDALLVNIVKGCVSSPSNEFVCNSAIPNNGNVASRVPTKISESAYWLADVSLQYTAPSDRWSITGYVNNAFDQRSYVSKGIQSASGSLFPQTGVITGTVTLPRTYGVIGTIRF